MYYIMCVCTSAYINHIRPSKRCDIVHCLSITSNRAKNEFSKEKANKNRKLVLKKKKIGKMSIEYDTYTPIVDLIHTEET